MACRGIIVFEVFYTSASEVTPAVCGSTDFRRVHPCTEAQQGTTNDLAETACEAVRSFAMLREMDANRDPGAQS